MNELTWEDKMRQVDALCGPIAETPKLIVADRGWVFVSRGLSLASTREDGHVTEGSAGHGSTPEAAVEAWWKTYALREDVNTALVVIDRQTGEPFRYVNWNGVAFVDVFPSFREQLHEAFTRPLFNDHS